MKEIALRTVVLPVLTTRVGHRIGRYLEIEVAWVRVEAKAVHGVERTPQWAVCIIAEPTVSAGYRFRIVLKVEPLVLSREEVRRRTLQPEVEILGRESLPLHDVVERVAKFSELRTTHAERSFTVSPCFDAFGRDP